MTVRALVVDDDESGRYLLASLMRGHGYDVIEAVDGEDALRQARSTPVGVVVTDILMPRMDGYQLCREWKADPDLCAAPLIFYSATYTDPADMRFADGLGADAFFVKPLEPNVLVSKIEAVMAEHEHARRQTREPSLTEETQVLREYNERLVSKAPQCGGLDWIFDQSRLTVTRSVRVGHFVCRWCTRQRPRIDSRLIRYIRFSNHDPQRSVERSSPRK